MDKFDLEKRTEEFSKDIIFFCRSVNEDLMLRPFSSQLIRSATSVGANYHEANGASSRKDFRNKIHICKKEAKETGYWLRLIGSSSRSCKESAQKLEERCFELEKIFGKITVSMSEKDKYKK